MAAESFVNTVRRGPVATVTMARPEVHNAFNAGLVCV
jgi:enoyl-CoA hydratase/carnithine racemase